MLKKSERLGRTAFAMYFKLGKRTHGTYATIITSPAPTFLCSVVVGKKVSKLAPKRNTIRRKIYGLIESLRQEKELTGVYIIITKPEILKLTKKDFQPALIKEIGRAVN